MVIPQLFKTWLFHLERNKSYKKKLMATHLKMGWLSIAHDDDSKS